MSRVKKKNWTCAIRFGLFESLLANFETYRSKAKTFDMHHETADGRGTNMHDFPNKRKSIRLCRRPICYVRWRPNYVRR